MNAKEKAIELVDKFINDSWNKTAHHMPTIVAKQCAIITVDEMVNKEGMFYHTDGTLNFWNEVKKEIKQL